MYKLIGFKQFVLCFGLIVLSANSHAIIWVGGDANCDYSSIQNALDQLVLGNDTTVAIANNIPGGVYNENLVLNYTLPVGIAINGGYDQCMGTNTLTPTEVNGTNTGPVFIISGGNTSQAISIGVRTLALKSGLNDASGGAGGLNFSSANTNLFLTRMSINNNRGIKGGGAYLDLQAGSAVYFDDTLVFNNVGANGGGFYCEGAGNFVFVRSNSSVAFNQAESGNAADGNGGGIFAIDQCPVFITSGDDLFSSIKGVVGNEAANHGGGAYLSSDAFLSLYKTTISNGDTEFATLKDNIADSDNNGVGDGGAVYLQGTGTQLSAREALIENNAAVNGGGIAVTSDALATFINANGNCSFNGHCFKFNRNTAGANVVGVGQGVGGAVFADNDGYAFFNRALFTENKADTGAVIGVDNSAGVLINGSNVYSNGGAPTNELSENSLFVALNPDTELNLTHVTVADNTVNSASSVFLAAFGSTIKTFNSLIFDTVDVMETFNANGSITELIFDCNLLHETDSLTGAVGNNFTSNTAAVNFVDSAGGDYRLQMPSTAIDLCPQAALNYADFEGEAFGFDVLDFADLFGPHDAGADESYLSDIIFKDSF